MTLLKLLSNFSLKSWDLKLTLFYPCHNNNNPPNKLGQRQSQTPLSSAFWVQKDFRSKKRFFLISFIFHKYWLPPPLPINDKKNQYSQMVGCQLQIFGLKSNFVAPSTVLKVHKVILFHILFNLFACHFKFHLSQFSELDSFSLIFPFLWIVLHSLFNVLLANLHTFEKSDKSILLLEIY